VNKARQHSWAPVAITISGALPPERPSVAGIVYPGRTHIWSGEPESLKSLLALILAHHEIRAGRSVLYIDYENGAREVLARLHALGLCDEEIDAGFIYLEPTEPITSVYRDVVNPNGTTTAVAADVERLITERQPSLVVIDGYTASLGLHGLDPDRGIDIETHTREVLRPLRASGAAVVLIDHLPKDANKRGRFSIGSERKVGSADVHLGFTVAQPFGRGRSALLRLRVHKDRPGHLHRPHLAEIKLVSDSITGEVTWEIRRASNAPPGTTTTFERAVLMERVSLFLEEQSEPISRSTIEAEVKGSGPELREAIDALVAAGYAQETDGPNRARLTESLRPFREDESVPSPSHRSDASPSLSPSPDVSVNDAETTSPSQSVPSPSLSPSRQSVPSVPALRERDGGRTRETETVEPKNETQHLGDGDAGRDAGSAAAGSATPELGERDHDGAALPLPSPFSADADADEPTERDDDRFPLTGDPDFVERILTRRNVLTHDELLARLRLHRLVAPTVQGTLDNAEIEAFARDTGSTLTLGARL
jgi:AAA domain